MSWKSLILWTGSESPVVVVLSGSMEPAFFRGDILFLTLGSEPFRNGEIVVYNVDQKSIPVVHRIIQVHEREPDGYVDILTKVSFYHQSWYSFAVTELSYRLDFDTRPILYQLLQLSVIPIVCWYY
jgi:signal peptidase I